MVPLLLPLLPPLLPLAAACGRGMVGGKLGRRRNHTPPPIGIGMPPLAAARVLLHSLVNTPRIGLSSYSGVCPIVIATMHIRQSRIILRPLLGTVIVELFTFVEFRDLFERLLLLPILVLPHRLKYRSAGSPESWRRRRKRSCTRLTF
ncbi:hypothetical protein B0H14DRAFT_2719932 [Mycena olivaceomarginata]|nr:hypothetical protein B0H14DRAFT_2719932 [Mycena olivaceomarginata]